MNNDVDVASLDERWLSHFGGPEHAASATVQAGSLLHLMEFSRYIGAVADPKPGDTDDEDGFGEGDEDKPAATDEQDLAPALGTVPFQAEQDDA